MQPLTSTKKTPSESQEQELQQLCRGLHRLWQIDLSCYNPRQLQRRLEGMYTRVGAQTPTEFLSYLRRHPEESAQWRERFMINVTEFFRDAHLYGRLERLLEADGFYTRCRKIWSAASSVGMEPYSVAMIMHRLHPEGRWRIEGTDLDEAALAEARRGTYSSAQVGGIPPVYHVNNMVQEGGEVWRVAPHLRARVSFSCLDLLRPAGRQPRDCDLILCRNVTIYFTDAAKEQVHRMLAEALRPGGLLFLGATERVPPALHDRLAPVESFFYRRTAAA